jgi:HlyD family secretion protein
VTLVPESAIEFKGDSTFVYLMTDSVPQQQFVRKLVKTGMSDGINIEIKNGLTPGQKVRGNELN